MFYELRNLYESTNKIKTAFAEEFQQLDPES